MEELLRTVSKDTGFPNGAGAAWLTLQESSLFCPRTPCQPGPSRSWPARARYYLSLLKREEWETVVVSLGATGLERRGGKYEVTVSLWGRQMIPNTCFHAYLELSWQNLWPEGETGKKEIQMCSWEENNIVKSIPIILKIGLNETLTYSKNPQVLVKWSCFSFPFSLEGIWEVICSQVRRESACPQRAGFPGTQQGGGGLF